MGHNPMTDVLRIEKFGHRHKETPPCEDAETQGECHVTMETEIAVMQQPPKASKRPGKIPPRILQKEHGPQTSSLQNREQINLLFQAPSLWYFVMYDSPKRLRQKLIVRLEKSR